jgi:hypothetical protein
MNKFCKLVDRIQRDDRSNSEVAALILSQDGQKRPSVGIDHGLLFNGIYPER